MSSTRAILEPPEPSFVPANAVEAAVRAIRSHWSCEATTAVILGTGLGELADELSSAATLSYANIPGFARSTALAHRGRLVCGELGGRPVVMLQGRCHGYEGHSLDTLTFPVRVLAALGIHTLILTNAAGGLNPNYAVGDVMVIDDHIDLMNLRSSPPGFSLVTPHPEAPASFAPYDAKLASLAASAARRGDFVLHRGVYVAVSGPSYETRAEYRAFRRIGGDCVGMSTVPEVLAAAHCGLRVLGLSTVTNVACPDKPKTVSAEEVVEVAAIAQPRVRTIIRAIL
jgi:purine-nucleoside phosphorylase